jgi:hypothetical protein
LVKASAKEVKELIERPTSIRHFLPNLSEREPKGMAKIEAIIIKEKAISPTSAVEAPMDFA